MLQQEEIKDLLVRSLEDYRVSGDERDAIRALAIQLSAEQRRYMKNASFDLVREILNTKEGGLGSVPLLNWLERVLKAIDYSVQDLVEPRVYFSPGRECKAAIIDLCRKAVLSIDICIFTLSDNDITKAVLEAFNRGVSLRIISDNDKSNDLGSDIDYLMKKGLSIRLDDTDVHMHHKFALFDQRFVLTGSFNWTRSASQHNYENVLVQTDIKIMQHFSNEFERLWSRFA